MSGTVGVILAPVFVFSLRVLKNALNDDFLILLADILKTTAILFEYIIEYKLVIMLIFISFLIPLRIFKNRTN